VAGVVETALPFVLGWSIAAIFLGAISVPRGSALSEIVKRSAVTWVLAFPFIVVLRALLLGRWSPWTFYLVAFTVASVMLLGWRLLFALWERRWATGSP